MRKIVIFRFEINPQPNSALANAMLGNYHHTSTIVRSRFGVISCLDTERTVEEIEKIVEDANCGCPVMVFEVPKNTNVNKGDDSMSNIGIFIMASGGTPEDGTPTEPSDPEERLNELLDKVSKHGIGSLSEAEKRELNDLTDNA